MVNRIAQDTPIRSLGHIYASQNASGELQRANYVGPARAGEIIKKVMIVVDEFLS